MTSWWSSSPYKLCAAMNSRAEFEIFIPEDDKHYVMQEYKNLCACRRKPRRSSKIFHEMRIHYDQLLVQQNEMDIGLEPERVNKYRPEDGSIQRILFPFLNNEISAINNFTSKNTIFQTQEVHPLIQNITKQDLASSIFFMTASKIGKPIMMSYLQPKLEILAKKLGAKVYNFIRSGEEFDHTFIQVTGLSFHKTNISLILDFQNMNSYTQNISGDFLRIDSLIRNLTLSNSHFADFLTNDVEEILLGMASHSIHAKIDTNAPVLGVIHRKQSFLAITFYFTCFDDNHSSTTYNAIALPTDILESNMYCVDVPDIFSSQLGQPGYIFSDGTSKSVLTECVNEFLGSDGGDIYGKCGTSQFSEIRLKTVMLFESHRIMYARGKEAIVTIICPGVTQKIFKLTFDILIFIAPQNCLITYNSEIGFISIRQNETILQTNQNNHGTMILIQYNLLERFSTDNYQNVVIIILSTATTIIVSLIAIIVYCFVTRHISTKIGSNKSLTYRRESEIDEITECGETLI